MLQQLPGHSSTVGQVLSNLRFWNTCLNIVQSSLVTVGWHGWVGQDRVLFKAALCWLGFTNFLALLHDLSPRQRKRRLGEHVCPRERRYLGGQLERQPGVVATEAGSFYLEQECEYERCLQRLGIMV